MKTSADFILDTKAQVYEDDGSLYIEGFAANSLPDRQDEFFDPQAFDASVKSFLETNPVLLYHHDPSKALGRVLELEKKPEGLWMKAVIDPPSPGSWAEDIYSKVKRGTIKGLSVGGKFYRRLVGGKPFIHRADLMEISVTPLPVNAQTLLAVAGKAFADDDFDTPESPSESQIQAVLDGLERIFDSACHNGR
jgi:HK97 family phage prohead protease